ncbi:MAG: tyrosine-type recombinase/integrase [Terriglobales bacterium]
MRASFQSGSIIRVSRKSGDAWRYRWREGAIQHSEFIGTLKAMPTRAQAEKAAERFRKLANSNVECITMADLIAKFWKDCPPERATTANSYRSIFKRIEEKWGSLRIDSFCSRVLEVEAWLKDLKVVGRHPKSGAPAEVSALYKGQVRNLCHLLMEKAMLWGHAQVERNPMDLVRLKNTGIRAKELVILTVEQYAALLEDEQLPEVVKVMVQVMAGLGLRVSECLGLRWSDLNFETGTIQIQRSVVHGQASDTKTVSSKSVLPLHENLVEVLKAWKAHEGLRSHWIFCSPRTGRPLDRDSLREEHLKPAGERIGVDGLGWHALRHFYRALLRQSGTPLEAQKNLMRHSKLATTMDIYGGSNNAENLRPANAKVVDLLTRRSA